MFSIIWGKIRWEIYALSVKTPSGKAQWNITCPAKAMSEPSSLKQPSAASAKEITGNLDEVEHHAFLVSLR
jgi:hypothetical protein